MPGNGSYFEDIEDLPDVEISDDEPTASENSADEAPPPFAPHGGETSDSPSAAKDLVLPVARIKRIMKQEPGVKQVAADANFLIAKAAELFMSGLAARAGEHLMASQRAQLAYGDVASSVATWPACSFLNDVVPQKVVAKQIVQAQRQQAKAGTPGKKRAPKSGSDSHKQRSKLDSGSKAQHGSGSSVPKAGGVVKKAAKSKAPKASGAASGSGNPLLAPRPLPAAAGE